MELIIWNSVALVQKYGGAPSAFPLVAGLSCAKLPK